MTDSAPPSPASSSADEPDPLDFTPVPCRTRHGWTAARQRGFIAGLARIGLVKPAAAEVGMSRQSAYRLRSRAGAESFAAAWDAAVELGLGASCSAAIERALNGVVIPYFYGGLQRGAWRQYDNRLLLAALQEAERKRGLPVAPAGGSTEPPPPAVDIGERFAEALRKVARDAPALQANHERAEAAEALARNGSPQFPAPIPVTRVTLERRKDAGTMRGE
ncbi:hypothetical protein [Novosphingopyxis sp.]|uniref:hypothetical protein n=1 Tax=Novosphingopyxis sp. TaxID=2709690 RepID=UPI003B5CBDBB